MQRGPRKGQGGPSPKTCQQKAWARCRGGGWQQLVQAVACDPPQNLSMCMSVLFGLSQTWELKTAEVYSLSVLRPELRNQGVCRVGPFGREYLFTDSPSIWCGWQSLASLAQSYITPVSASIITWSSVCICVFSPL